jgi:integrase
VETRKLYSILRTLWERCSPKPEDVWACLKRRDHESTGAKSSVGKGKGRDPSGLSFHSLSHTAVTLLKETGVPHAVVQELIGHDSEQMSEHYTHVGSEALKKAAAALPDVTST